MNSNFLLFVLSFLLVTPNGFAQIRQTIPPLDSMALPHVIAISHDALGNLYAATTHGELIKLNEHLSVEQRYSSTSISRMTSLEASQMLKIFTFYQNSQQFQFFDRFLTPSPINTIKNEAVSHYSVATLSNDQMIWLVDDTQDQLIKYHPILEDVVLRVDLRYYLPGNAQVKSLKEYGNRLYLWQNGEVLVFDFLGNLIQKLPIHVEKPFTFYKNQLYYPVGKQVHVYDLLSMQQKSYDFNLSQDINFVIKTDSRIYLITKDQIGVFLLEG